MSFKKSWSASVETSRTLWSSRAATFVSASGACASTISTCSSSSAR
jgi:hypothetical protein